MQPTSKTNDSHPATFWELYGSGNISHAANDHRRNLNLTGLRVLDLRSKKETGENWDFSRREDRELALALLDSEDPDWVVGAPPCTVFSLINANMNFPRLPPHVVKERLAAGRVHLKFVARIYRAQLRRGKFFLFEHPALASSWRDPSISALAKRRHVGMTTCNQCMFGFSLGCSVLSYSHDPNAKREDSQEYGLPLVSAKV